MGTKENMEAEISREELLKQILQPDDEFSPMPFWFFNDVFDEEKVRGQLADYAKKGVNGFVLHPRIGVPKEMPYLSEEYFWAVRFIVGTAAELGMKVALYDEGMYPSGSAHGRVVEADPEYASKGIILLDPEAAKAKLDAEQNAQTVAELPDGRRIVYGFTGGTIRGIHFGEDDGEPEAPKAADILNPLAVEEFIRLTHDRYYEELKEYFGTTVIAFFTDEPSPLGRGGGGYRPWVPGLEKEIEAAGGRTCELEGLFAGTEKIAGRADIEKPQDSETVRIYHRLIKEKLRRIFYARLSEWCIGHGIGLMGHPAESDDIEEELYFQIPGQDLIMRRVAPETGGLREFDSVQAKLSADIARHLGRRRNANECFGVCVRNRIPWYMTAGDMKWYIDWLGMRGVNLYVPHAFYYSVAGKRKDERPPDVGPNNIWWRHYKRFSDYMKRFSFLMTDSVNGAEIAVLCDNNHVPYEEIACLYENQREFNYLPAALLEQAQVQEGRVCIGGYAYRGVLNLLGQEYQDRFGERLGRMLWTAPEGEGQDAAAFVEEMFEKKELAEAFAEEVLVKAELAEEAFEEAAFCVEGSAEERAAEGAAEEGSREKALEEEPAEERPAEKSAEEGAAGRQRVSFDIPCKDLRMVRLNKRGVDMLLLCNEGRKPLSTGMRVPGLKSPLLVDLWKGRAFSVEGAGEYFWLSLQPSETVLVMDAGDGFWGQSAGCGNLCVSSQGSAGAGFLACEYPDWTDRFTLVEKRDNVAVYELEYPWERPSDTSLRKGVGFTVRGQEMVECFCNEEFVDVSFWGRHRFDLTGFLRKGKNEIRLVVTGNAANVYEDAGIEYGLE